jgi:hypothetical protein
MDLVLGKFLVEALRAGADAADNIDACAKCGVDSGERCVTSTTGEPGRRRHTHRLPGDPVLSFTLRAIADDLEDRIEKFECEGRSFDETL